MSYNAVPTVLTGDSWSASQHNTYIRDNFAAGVPDIFSAAGDIAYATAADVAARLAKPSVLSYLTMPGSGTPAWESFGALNAITRVSFQPNGQTSTSTTTATAITGATVDIVTTTTCTILMIAHVSAAIASVGHGVRLRGSIDGTADADTDNYGQTGLVYYSSIPYTFYRTGIAAGTITCLMLFGSSNAGINANIDKGGFIVIAISE